MKKIAALLLALIMCVMPFAVNADGEALPLSHEWAEVSMGETHAAAIQPVGLGYAWGYNYNGAIGNGVTSSTNTTVPYNFAENLRAVMVNRKTTLSIDNSDVLRICGEIWFGAGGETGMPIPYVYSTPIEFAQDVRHAAMGYNHIIYVKNDGTVWVYGENDNGQLGDGTTNNSYTPKQVTSLSNVVYVAAGYNLSAAVKSDGTLWTWGLNTYGQVGNNSTTDRKTPVQVLTNVFSVSVMGDHVLALKNDGSVWAWGRNDYGQLGKGSTSVQRTPVQVMTGAAQVSAGYYHSAVLKTDGTLWFAGRSYRGCFGNGTPGSYSAANSTFTQTAGSYAAVKCGLDCTAVVAATGQLYTAGYNGYGQLGTGSTAQSVPAFTPIDVWVFGGGEPQEPLIGDVDVNGKVEFADVSLYASYLLNLVTLTDQGVINADANQDGTLNSLDTAAIYRIALSNVK